MADRWERVTSLVLAAAAVVMAVGITHRAFVAGQAAQGAGRFGLDSTPDWREALPIGETDGPVTAPVTIVEFADLECPACRALQPTIEEMQSQYPAKLSVVWVNYPLPYHRFAMSAAQAGVCADRMGAFDRWRDEVFKEQDSLGLKSWGAMAATARIPDTASIALCAHNGRPVADIEAGKRLGAKIGVSGTPTVIINGWRFSNVPSADQLKQAIDAELKGHRPPGALGASG